MVHYIPTVNIDYSNLKSNWLLLNLSPLHPATCLYCLRTKIRKITLPFLNNDNK